MYFYCFNSCIYFSVSLRGKELNRKHSSTAGYFKPLKLQVHKKCFYFFPEYYQALLRG